MRPSAPWAAAPGLAAALLLGACQGVSDNVRETAVNVVTLQSGTISELRDRRGQGPFRTFDVPPDRMLELLEGAARRARTADGRPVEAVFVSRRYGEVVAKERGPGASDGYTDPFLSAMVATVHPVEGAPGQSRVEVHAMDRGPFHRGTVAWERDLWTWLEAERAGAPAPSATRPSGVRRLR